MKLSQFKFNLPEELVALYPHSVYHEIVDDKGEKHISRMTRRDESRLMVLHRKSQTIDMFQKNKKGKPVEGQYLEFRHVLDYFDEGDTFIFNDTKVFPARLYGTKEKTDAKIEVFLLRELNREMRLWDVLVEPARKIRIGNKLFFDESGTMVAEVIVPPYDLGLADTMIANFYHSMSPLLMETAAFGGYELVMEAYNLAVKHGYKFGCYGDSLLILDD